MPGRDEPVAVMRQDFIPLEHQGFTEIGFRIEVLLLKINHRKAAAANGPQVLSGLLSDLAIESPLASHLSSHRSSPESKKNDRPAKAVVATHNRPPYARGDNRFRLRESRLLRTAQNVPPRPINHQAIERRLHARQLRCHSLAQRDVIPQLLWFDTVHQALRPLHQFIQLFV